jgi:hypothetical protein
MICGLRDAGAIPTKLPAHAAALATTEATLNRILLVNIVSSQHVCHASSLGTDNREIPRIALGGCSLAYIGSTCCDTTLTMTISERSPALQVRQHAHAAVDMLRGYGDDFLADAMKFQIDAHIAYGQSADAQRLDADG